MTSGLERVCQRYHVRLEAQFGAAEPPEDFPAGSVGYRVVLRMGRKRLTTNFYMGPAHSEPSAADVLACLISDATAGDQSFDEFCWEFGYDNDSRRAERTWKACRAMAPRVRRFLGERFDEFARAEH